MRDEERAAHLWHGLNDCKAISDHVTMAVVSEWIEHHGAGYPDVALLQEKLRHDAKYWATAATVQELETYLAAALMELERSVLTNRAAKRLAALGVKNMDLASREAFTSWMDKQNG